MCKHFARDGRATVNLLKEVSKSEADKPCSAIVSCFVKFGSTRDLNDVLGVFSFFVADSSVWSVQFVRLVRLKVQLSGPLSWLRLGIFWRALRRYGER